MTNFFKTLAISTALLAASGAVFAESHAAMSPEDAVAAHQTHMKLLGQNMGVLGGMAQGKMDYDAAAAQAAADALVENAMIADMAKFPEGSDSDSIATSRALPAIWTNFDDFTAKAEAFAVAATGMQAAAGQGLEAVQAAMGALGGSCGSCHETYRKPK